MFLSNIRLSGRMNMSWLDKERVTCDQLTIGQWIAGFCRAIREETNQNSKEAMLDYLISLLDDANNFSWSFAKACHAVLLCRMEQGKIKDYTQNVQIDRVRHAHAQRHVSNGNDIVKNIAKRGNSKSMVCQYYNLANCSQQSTHKTKGVRYRHVCSY